jgi:hypothetical protein
MKPLFWLLATCLSLGWVLVAGCQNDRSTSPATEPVVSTSEQDLAGETAKRFFDFLQASHYADAAGLYGGSYEVLQGWNPSVNPADSSTLWRNGCSINGLKCLKIRSIQPAAQTDAGEFVFNVEFSTRDGELFVLGACCGADETEQPPVSIWPIRVAKGIDGRYRVMDLPPYVP